eukprot:gene1909-biopygen1786
MELLIFFGVAVGYSTDDFCRLKRGTFSECYEEVDASEDTCCGMAPSTASFEAFTWCAAEGSTCTCQGTAYYGRKYLQISTSAINDNSDPPDPLATLADVKDTYYISQEVNGDVSCNTYGFGYDPLPGHYKHCICYEQEETVVDKRRGGGATQPYAMGSNAFGQLGATQSSSTQVLEAIDVLLDAETVSIIAAGTGHTIFVTSDGHAYATGANDHGQLGTGEGIQVSTPVQVMAEFVVTGACAGAYHTCFLVAGGLAYTSGRNDYGQLGDGTTLSRTDPVEVVLAGGVQRNLTIGAAGAYHTVFLTDRGEAYATGWNDCGQLGINLEMVTIVQNERFENVVSMAYRTSQNLRQVMLNDIRLV